MDSMYSLISSLKKEWGMEWTMINRLSEQKGSSVRLGEDLSGSFKYHSSEHSTNPLERISFALGEKMVESPRIRFLVSCYVLVVHCILLVLILRQTVMC